MNLAGNFFKDIKENTSINQLGSKIKNISQNTSWLPAETKEMLQSAANSIQSAAGPAPSSSPAPVVKKSQSQNQTQMQAPQTTTSPKKKEFAGSAQSIQPRSPKLQDDDGDVALYENKKTGSSSPAKAPVSAQALAKRASFRAASPPDVDSPDTHPQKPPTVESQNQIDPQEYTALFETNQALKSELQRLSVFELKCKSLEKELKAAKMLKEANDKLELECHELKTFKEKCERLESELERMKVDRANDDSSRNKFEAKTSDHLERLAEENANLKNKIRDLDRLIDEYEQKYSSLRSREQAIEQQNKHLENELDRLSENASSSTEMHSQKLVAIEQANRVLEQELESLKEQQRSERVKVKEKMEALTGKQNEKIRKLEETNKALEAELARIKLDSDTIIGALKQQFDDYKRRISELESFEKVNQNLEGQLKVLKDEIRSQNEHYLDEKKKFDVEKKNFESLNENYAQMNEAMLNISRKYEQDMSDLGQKLSNLESLIEKKDAELAAVRASRENDSQSFLAKLNFLNEENVQLSNQLKGYAVKDEEIAKLKKRINDLLSDNDKLQSQLKSYQTLESELVDVHMKNSGAQEHISELERQLEDINRRHAKELADVKQANTSLQTELRQKRQELSNEALKNDTLIGDCSRLKTELSRMEVHKQRVESLERELAEAKVAAARVQKSDYDVLMSRRAVESGEKFEAEIKLLHSQQNELRIKEQECRHLEKLLDAERLKTQNLMKQLEELSSMNSQLTMHNSDAKRRLVSLELLTEECNQLRKNLTLMTIESESRKAEITTLNSQINILENTVKSLREGSEKYSQMEANYDCTVSELRKKQDDLKKLQQFHDTVKKEQQDTIELLEEKLRDVEKKTELQSLKHEEILLELESIRARRERLMPICPNCSTQTIQVYQPIHPHPQPQIMSMSQPQYAAQSHPHSQMASPVPQQPITQPIQIQPQAPAQQLLSISIPQQTASPISFSPLSIQHLPQVQLIAIAGKQSVTVDCQTSPTSDSTDDREKTDLLNKFMEMTRTVVAVPSVVQVEKQEDESQTEPPPPPVLIPKASSYSQTDLRTFVNKELNTDPPPVVATRNQATFVDLYAEQKEALPKKIFEDKSVQSMMELPQVPAPQQPPPPPPPPPKDKYILYNCKYSYDPFKNSPNDNPEAELPLQANEYLFILSEDDEDGFYMGELLSGKRGLVPSNFIEKVIIDQNNLQKNLTSLPKNVFLHEKFNECLAYYNLDASLLALTAQQLLQKLNSMPPPPTSSVDQTQQTVGSTSAGLTQSKSQKLDGKGVLMLPQNPLEPASSTSSINEPQIKIGLPYPNNLKVEKRSESSLLVSWDPPTAPLPINQSIDVDNLSDLNEQLVTVQSYNLYLNNELRSVISGVDERVAILDDIDLSVPNRISIQAVIAKGIMSKPQECTLLFGSNRSFAPSNLSVLNLTQTSAIVSWWPSSSLFSHVISIDSIEHRTLKPGIFKFKLSGLLPDTSHMVTVTAQIPNHTNESSSNYAASVEFRTLPSRTLGIPTDLALEKDPQELDAYLLTWKPVVVMPNTVSNGIQVGGYSIYLDGVRVHQILNPFACSVSLSSKLLFNGAKQLTLRTLSLDGNAESKDSEPIKLSKSMQQQMSQQSLPEAAKKPIPAPIQAPTLAASNQQSLDYPAVSTPKKQLQQQQSQPLPQQPQIVEQKFIPQQQSLPTEDKLKPKPQSQASQIEQPATAISQVKKPATTFQMPKVSDATKKPPKTSDSNRNMFEDDADLYENNRAAKEQVTKPQTQRRPSRQTSPVPNKPSPLVAAQKPTKDVQKPTNGTVKKQSYRVFIALFDYDPFKMSPNTDSCQEELPFKEGQLIKVYGKEDDDGFFYGESNGRRGYIPCNMVSELQADDPEVVKQLLLSEQQSNNLQPGGDSSDKKQKKSSTSTSRSAATTKSSGAGGTTAAPGVNKQQSVSKSKDQQFAPISGAGHQYSKPGAPQPAKNLMVALYDYDPQSLSPNVDADAELPFKMGDVINVIGEMDDDGFYLGELNGRRGLVPSNFLEPIQQSEQDHHYKDAYEVYEDLGSGQFAVVRRCKDRATGLEYAAKFVVKRRPSSSSRKGLFREKILQEIEILSELNHPNIIKLHHVFETPQEMILVLELVKGGELFEYISEKDHVSESDAAKFITQILEGVSHFHARNIVHLDLKPENVMLLDRQNCLIKIIDFGISRKLKPGEKVMETYGTPEFVVSFPIRKAPEIIQYQPISTATDMWSIGVITYILLSGASPFLGDSKQETFANITNIDYSFDDEYFGNTSDLAKDFISRLFVKDVRKRATVRECLEHPWIKPRRSVDEDVRRVAQINIEHLKSFIARRRWKVQMQCESRSVRTVTTKYTDSEGNVKSRRRAELTGKSVLYEGEYSETDSDAEQDTATQSSRGSREPAPSLIRNLDGLNLGTAAADGGSVRIGIDSIRILGGGTFHKPNQTPQDASMMKRQKVLTQIPNIELKPVKVTEFNEAIDEHSDSDDNQNGKSSPSDHPRPYSRQSSNSKLSQAELQEKINNHLSINPGKKTANGSDQIISDESKEDEKSDIKVIDSTDEKTGTAVRTSIENRMKTNENVKVCKAGEQVDVQETDDAIVKKITTKTRTTKSVVKTTTTTTTKKGIRRQWVQAVCLCNRIIRKSQLRLSTNISLDNINCVSFGKNLLDDGDDFVLTALLCAAEDGNYTNLKQLLQTIPIDVNRSNKNNETALHIAASNGHLHIIQLLKEHKVDFGSLDQNGESAIHFCCRCQNTDTSKLLIGYLIKNGVSIDFQNKDGETALHLACRYGSVDVVKILCELRANLDIQDDQLETALHVASWHGFHDIVKCLCHYGCDVNAKNKEGESALIIACARGFIDIVRTLTEYKADLNCRDSRKNTALHWAVRRHYAHIALALIQAECNMDLLDANGDSALHIACRENLLPVVQTMCALGCRVDIKNKKDMTPLHTATEKNEIDAVRCLCLAGLDLSITNKDGMTAEQLAGTLRHVNIANLLSSLRREQNRELFIEQLIPTGDQLRRIKIKVFGSSGVGKTSLIGSMNCSYINSFFRRLSVKSSSKASSKPQKNYGKTRNPLEKIDDAFRIMSNLDRDSPLRTSNGHLNTTGVVPSTSIEIPEEESGPHRVGANVLDNYEPAHTNYTRGIEITQSTFHGTHHFSIWEFSGYEPYKIVYDQFVGCDDALACIHLVAYSLTQSQTECLRECAMWLEYLRARISTSSASPAVEREPNHAVSSRPGLKGVVKVLFVATHADEDKSGGVKKADDGRNLSEKARAVKTALEALYSNERMFDLSADHFVLDARAAWMADIKQLIEQLIKLKQSILDSLPRCTMFLNRTLFNIQNWRKIINSTGANPSAISSSMSQTSLHSTASTSQAHSPVSTPSTPGFNSLQTFKFGGSTLSINEPSWSYPLIRWKQFVEHLREHINPLASDEHLHELIWQLQIMGECVLIPSGQNGDTDADLVCFQPEWLCARLFGRLFAHERFFQLDPQNLNGIYKLADLKTIFADLCTDVNLLKDIFMAYRLCAEWEDDGTESCSASSRGDLVYEFAALNFLSEPLPLAFKLVKQFNFNKQPTFFITNGFQIRQSDFHLNRSSLRMDLSIATYKITQLASLFFLIQVTLRSLVNSFNVDPDVGKIPKQGKIGHQNQEQRSQAPQSRCHHRDSLVKSHSKLDQLLRAETSTTSPNGSNPSSYPTTANSTMNILQSPSLTSTRHHHSTLMNPEAGLSPEHTLKMNGALIDLELYQTRYCSRITRKSCFIECLLSLDHVNGEFIELRACAPEMWREELFYFVQDLFALVEWIVADACPNVNLERHYLNFKPFRVDPDKRPASLCASLSADSLFTPKDIIQLELEKKTQNFSKLTETRLVDLIYCGSDNIERHALPGVDLSFSHINSYTRRMICSYLDRADPMGRDWSILAFLLGLQDFLPRLDASNPDASKCDSVLVEWCRARADQATIRNLLGKINDLGRLDVYDMICNTIAPFRMRISKDSGIQNSNQTLASLK